MRYSTVHFVLSQPRSGSTLLRLILSKAENYIALPEIHFFPFKLQYSSLHPQNIQQRKLIAKNWINYFTIKKMEIDSFKLENDIIEYGNSWKDIFELTIKSYKNQYFPEVINPIYIEKSPPHIFFGDEIRVMYPDSKFIHLIRDPRSTIASLKTMSWSTSNIYTLSRSWVKSINLLENKPNILHIRYEDLVKKTDEIVLELTSFLEINNDITGYSKGFTDHVENKNWNSSEISKPINTDNLEKWKKMLSSIDGEVQVIENICNNNMKKYGYELLNLPKNSGYYSLYLSSFIQLVIFKLLKKVYK